MFKKWGVLGPVHCAIPRCYTRRAGGAAAAQGCWQAHYGRVVLGVRRRLGRLDQSAVVRLGQRCSVVGGHHLARLHPSVSLARATTGTPGHPNCIPARTTIGTPGHPKCVPTRATTGTPGHPKCIPSPGRHRYAWASQVYPSIPSVSLARAAIGTPIGTPGHPKCFPSPGHRRYAWASQVYP